MDFTTITAGMARCEMKGEEKEMRVFLDVLGRSKAGKCPSEELLSAFAEDKLTGAEREKVAEHVLRCEDCLDALSVVSAQVPHGVKVPVELMRKAVELVPSREGLWEVVVRFVADTLEVLKNTGDRTRYFVPAYATVRGTDTSSSKLVAVTRRFAGLEAELEIERTGSDTSEIKVFVKNLKDNQPAKNMRANLLRGDKELMSYVLQGGVATFDKVGFGEYVIEFTKKGIPVGRVSLELKGE